LGDLLQHTFKLITALPLTNFWPWLCVDSRSCDNVSEPFHPFARGKRPFPNESGGR
jgi:hypothetical protein